MGLPALIEVSGLSPRHLLVEIRQLLVRHLDGPPCRLLWQRLQGVLQPPTEGLQGGERVRGGYCAPPGSLCVMGGTQGHHRDMGMQGHRDTGDMGTQRCEERGDMEKQGYRDTVKQGHRDVRDMGTLRT